MTDWKNLKAHPLAKAFPPIDADTFQELMASLKDEGYDASQPIWIFQGMILDGLNRHFACTQTGVEPTLAKFDGTAEKAIDFCLRRNLFRRHLTADARAQIALDMEGFRLRIAAASATPQNRDKAAFNAALSQKRGANEARVSVRTMRNAESLRAIAPEAVAAVKAGRTSAVAAIKRAKIEIAKRAAPTAPEPELDAAKRPMHPAAADALTDGRARFIAVKHDLDSIKRDLKNLAQSPLGRLLSWDSVETDLANIARAVRFAAPFTSCPMDDACNTTCKLCRGTQWIGESQWEGVPNKLKETNK